MPACRRITKVGQNAIAEVFRDMPAIAGDRAGDRVLIAPHQFAQIFRIEPL